MTSCGRRSRRLALTALCTSAVAWTWKSSRTRQNLSGGQRQRLALARALLHDTPAYVFDEATSNADAESEEQVMAAVRELSRERAVLVISLRLANVVDTARIMWRMLGFVKPLAGVMVVSVVLWRRGLLDGLDARSRELVGAEREVRQAGARGSSAVSAVILLATIAELALGAQLVSAGSATPEATVLATVFVLSSFGPFAALANLGATLQGTLASGARVLEILDEKPQVDEVENGVVVTFSDASAQHVDFSYGAEKVLSDVSVRIPAGRIVGISGRSGSGKSTLARLLMRFWDVDQGRKASIHDFIESLPGGYDTMVGELGGTISSGERQRLGLARAFLHDAPFLLLDEPTSNLDSLNEGQVLRSLDEERGRRAPDPGGGELEVLSQPGPGVTVNSRDLAVRHW